jgi:prepilin-type N-terminal cleavage/methylation domain-containing protein
MGRMRNQNKVSAGFSLYELMIVLALLSVITTLASPRFRNFQNKAYQAERTSHLNTIYILQEAFYAEHLRYGGDFEKMGTQYGAGKKCDVKNELGFTLTPCSRVRFQFTNESNGDSFLATAKQFKTFDEEVLEECALSGVPVAIDQTRKIRGLSYDISNIPVCNPPEDVGSPDIVAVSNP